MMDINKTPTLGGDPRLQLKIPSSEKNPYILLNCGNSNLSTVIDSISRKNSSKIESDDQYSYELFLYSKNQAFQMSPNLELSSNNFAIEPNPSDLNQIYYPNIVIKQTSNTTCKVDNIKHKTEIIKSKILNKQLNDNNDNDTSKTDSDIDYKEESLSEAFCSSVDDY